MVATLVARTIVTMAILLEDSNLNRVRGYRRSDVGKSKAATLARYIRDLV
ncbi:hypothetical protein [Mesorhizobium ventifaucium]|nr:hypothetical protein [Mesorhizobium ventifaucium]